MGKYSDSVVLNTAAVSTAAGFARFASGGKWKRAPHLNLISRKLYDLSERNITHLLISMPPRHGKTWLTSQYFPAQYLGRFPEHNVLLSSYGADFARGWSQKARAILAGSLDIFPARPTILPV